MASAATTSSSSTSHGNKTVEVRFKTADERFAVPDTVMSVPSGADAKALNALLKSLLEEFKGEVASLPDFDFVVLGELVRESLGEVLTRRCSEGAEESVHEVLYIQKQGVPDPKSNANHDDWVGGVAVCPFGTTAGGGGGDLVLTACYDSTVNLWEAEDKSGRIKKLLTIPGHSAPAKAVVWVTEDTFASGSHDQTVMLYRLNRERNEVDGVNVCRGHQRSVECLATPLGSTTSTTSGTPILASGSFDSLLKVWGATVEERGQGQCEDDGEGDDDGDDEEGSRKKAKSDQGASSATKKKTAPPTRTPLVTLAGHKEAISGLAFMGGHGSNVCSASWDHTMRLWDIEAGAVTSEIVGSKSFFGVSFSPENGLLIAAGAERSLKLYDPRSSSAPSSASVVVKGVYTSHQGWVTCVDWCRDGSGVKFVSGSHDNLVKMWDLRSHRTPLYDLSGHTDRVLCCDWSKPDLVASGGADNDMKTFSIPKL